LQSAQPLAVAEKHPLSAERLHEQVGRLGGTPFKLGSLAIHIEGSLLLPVSELNRLRRDLVRELEYQRTQPKLWKLNSEIERAKLLKADRPLRDNGPLTPALSPSEGERENRRQSMPKRAGERGPLLI